MYYDVVADLYRDWVSLEDEEITNDLTTVDSDSDDEVSFKLPTDTTKTLPPPPPVHEANPALHRFWDFITYSNILDEAKEKNTATIPGLLIITKALMKLASLKSTSVDFKANLLKKCFDILKNHVIVTANGDDLIIALDMMEKVELLEEIMIRMGDGLGEEIESLLMPQGLGNSTQAIAQKLNETHYTTDGLTLPAKETTESIEEVLRAGDWRNKMANFLADYSNLALSLRILSSGKVDDIDSSFKDQTLQKLASRCLNHTVIDVELSTAYLLLLSQKSGEIG